ncbi:MAG: HIT domain-containing protein [Phycisphaera sp.]|nr:HIT domain-containing protein [Phycisphaera sp.]
MAYIKDLDPAPGSSPGDKPNTCFLCEAIPHAADSQQGIERLLLINDERGLMLLNRFPYTNGHLLIAPREHVGSLTDLTPQVRANLMELTVVGQQLLTDAMHPQGMNIGINLGRCAGAGLPGHIHIHIVPRWNGDTNFMPVFGQVRVIPQALEEAHAWLREALNKH